LAAQYAGQVPLNLRNQWPKVLHTVPESLDRDDSDADSLHVLLEFDTRVVRDEYFESGVDGRAK
jgi:hypothetical protein